ncbi:MAG: Hsp20/alpha crystallin family protein [Candidatus Sumerlaeia bacterium]|nr:Hsp20/alpha crystallin family protein [Candidatus Sumerlaeia bacterium]
MRVTVLLSAALVLIPGLMAQDQPGPAKTEPATGAQAPSLAPLAPPESEAQTDALPQWQSLADDPATGALFQQSPGATNTPARTPGVFDPFASDPFFSRGPRTQGVFDPFAMMQQQLAEMQQWQAQMDQHFQSLFQQMPNAQVYGFSTRGGSLEDRGDRYEIVLEISGLESGTAQLDVQGNQLVLQCRQQQSSQTRQGGGQSACSFVNNIQQRWTLPNDADRTAIRADSEGDTLTITIPKLQGVPSTISVPIQ